MKANGHSQLYIFLKYRIVVMFTVLVALVSLIGYLYYSEHLLDVQKNLLIDIMGRQRMLSQVMAKEAAQITLANLELAEMDRPEDQAVAQERIRQAKANMAVSRELFQDTLDSIRKGSFTYQGKSYSVDRVSLQAVVPTLNRLLPEWERFVGALTVLEQTDGITESSRKAMAVIRDTNPLILQQSIDICNTLIESLEGDWKGTLEVFALIFMLFLATLLFMLYDIYRNAMLPMDMFYKKIGQVGIGKSILKVRHGNVYPVLNEVNEVVEGVRDIISLIENISQKSTFYDTLQFIYDAFRRYIPYSYIGIALFDREHPTRLEAAYGISDGTFQGLPERLLGETTEISKTSLGNIMNTMKPRIINDLEAYAKVHTPQRYTQIILEEGIRSSITLPLKSKGRVLGFIFFSSRKKGEYSERHCEFLETIVNALTISFEKNIFTDELLYSSVLALAKLAEAKDEDTAVHLDRIKDYTAIMANCMRADGLYPEVLTDDFIKDVVRFSPMHDIGKVGVRDEVLLKPGKLTGEEFDHVKTHATFGAGVLEEAEQNILRTGKSMFRIGIEIAGGHHEKWDGSGYPNGLAGQAIPLSARIVSVVDVFDALTTRRPYKKPFAFEDAASIIREGAGKHFDPLIVQCFERNKELFRAKLKAFGQIQPDVYR